MRVEDDEVIFSYEAKMMFDTIKEKGLFNKEGNIMRFCRVDNATTIDLEKVNAIYTTEYLVSRGENGEIMREWHICMSTVGDEVDIFKTTDTDELFKIYEEVLVKLDEEVRLGNRLIDLRDILKGSDFYILPENVKEVTE